MSDRAIAAAVAIAGVLVMLYAIAQVSTVVAMFLGGLAIFAIGTLALRGAQPARRRRPGTTE